MKKLTPPCSYQGGKQRLAKQIIDIIFERNKINENTKFYDLCCGSGAITLELINRGIHPSNITMIDASMWGKFWNSIANEEFELDVFRNEINKLPEIEGIQGYLKKINKNEVDYDLDIYHFLLQQAGSFGSKYIDIKEGKWINSSFRSYWMPTETSNRKSVVNPMMPMPSTLYDRVKNIVDYMSGNIKALYCKIEDVEWHFDEGDIVYIDPPYKNTSGYNFEFDYEQFLIDNWNYVNIYVSEGYKIDWCTNAILLSKGRKKGNINGNINRKLNDKLIINFNSEFIQCILE